MGLDLTPIRTYCPGTHTYSAREAATSGRVTTKET